MLQAADVRRFFDYNSATGDIFYRAREASDFSHGRYGADVEAAKFNAKYAGKKAGTLLHIGYVVIIFRKKPYYAHRIAWAWMTGKWPLYVDHKDRDGGNNKWINLREATCSQNHFNTKRPVNNTSGFKGPSWDATNGNWVAQTKVRGKKVFIGTFRTVEDAHDAYLAYVRKVAGEFARAA